MPEGEISQGQREMGSVLVGTAHPHRNGDELWPSRRVTRGEGTGKGKRQTAEDSREIFSENLNFPNYELLREERP